MRNIILCVICASVWVLAGCGQVDYFRLARAGKDVVNAATVNDKDVAQMTMQMRKQMDLTSQLAPDKSKYQKRLDKLMATQTSVNGIPLNYKVYMNNELNANATPDGSIRVNSGMMDAMNDDELRFVVGHEIGHVAHGHAQSAMRTAYLTAAARTASGATNPYAALAADSALGGIAEDFLNAQYSQAQELDADSYGMNYLKTNHYNPDAAVSAIRKLGNSGGGFLEDHPSNERRIQNLEALKQGADPKTLTTEDK